MASAAVALSSHVPGPGLCSCQRSEQQHSSEPSDTHLELLGRGIPRIHELAIIPRRRPGSEIERDGLAHHDGGDLRLRRRGGSERDACAFCICLEVVGAEVGHGRSAGRRGGRVRREDAGLYWV